MITSASNSTQLPFVFYSSVALFYLAFTIVSALILSNLERRRGSQPV